MRRSGRSRNYFHKNQTLIIPSNSTQRFFNKIHSLRKKDELRNRKLLDSPKKYHIKIENPLRRIIKHGLPPEYYHAKRAAKVTQKTFAAAATKYDRLHNEWERYKEKVCRKRSERREELFKRKIIGKGRGGPKNRKFDISSLVRC